MVNRQPAQILIGMDIPGQAPEFRFKLGIGRHALIECEGCLVSVRGIECSNCLQGVIQGAKDQIVTALSSQGSSLPPWAMDR